MTGKTQRSKKPKGERSGIRGILVPLALGIVSLILLLDTDYNIFPFLNVSFIPNSMHAGLLILVIITFIWFSLRFLGYLMELVAAPRVGSYASVRSSWKAVNYTIWAIVMAIIFFYFMGGMESAVLSIGMIGAALTFVLQKPLMNILGWLFITYNRMFKIGDRVSIGDVKGYVTDIKVMHTDLYEMEGWMKGETFTGRIALVPNSMIFDGAVYNYTRDSPFIWDEVVNLVTYESNIDKAKQYMLESAREIVGEAMTKNREAYRKHLELHDLDESLPGEPTIRMELADSGVKLSVVYWTPAENRRRTKSEIVERVWRKFNQDPDVDIAYPHMEIVRQGKSSEGQHRTQ